MRAFAGFTACADRKHGLKALGFKRKVPEERDKKAAMLESEAEVDNKPMFVKSSSRHVN